MSPEEKKETTFPTGKPHISYSELFDWIECSWRHKLKYIEKLDEREPSIHTIFGTIIHDAMEKYVVQDKNNRKPIDPDPYIETFKNEMKDYIQKYVIEKGKKINRPQKHIDSEVRKLEKDTLQFSDTIPPLLLDAPKWLDEQFPGWEIVEAEHYLYEPIDGYDIRFKGFIDTVLKVPKTRKVKKKPKKTKKLRLSIMSENNKPKIEVVPGEYDYWIIDWKTTSWGWNVSKKRDFNKQLQIMLYKYFYCRSMNLNPKDFKCGFVLLKRKEHKKSGSHCELVKVSFGPKSRKRALDVLHNMINQVNKEFALKNRNSCRFCNFANTEHCI